MTPKPSTSVKYYNKDKKVFDMTPEYFALVGSVPHSISCHLSEEKIASDVAYYVTSSGILTDVVLFVDSHLMKEKGYSCVRVDYSDEFGYTFYMVGGGNTRVIQPEDKPCLLGLVHVSDLKHLQVLFEDKGVTRETLKAAIESELFMKYYYQLVN